jgi:hypothetical protein
MPKMPWLVSVLVVVSLVSILLHAATLTWGAGVLAGQLVVVFDTTASPGHLVIEEASFNATFFDTTGRELGKRNVVVPPEQIVIGRRQSFTYQLPFPSASRVTTDALFARWYAEGLKNDGNETPSTESISATTVLGNTRRVVPPPPSMAGRCDEYAKRAVAQHAQNQLLGCGYEDTRWNANLSFHSQWCRSSAAGEPEQETINRDAILRRCARTRLQSIVPAAR